MVHLQENHSWVNEAADEGIEFLGRGCAPLENSIDIVALGIEFVGWQGYD